MDMRASWKTGVSYHTSVCTGQLNNKLNIIRTPLYISLWDFELRNDDKKALYLNLK